jgi:hypothetical protein
MALGAVGCVSDADVASHNISKAAEMFQIERRVVFYDSIQGTYLLSIEGRCSIDDYTSKLTITCKTADDEYKKHYLGRADNVTYFAEQLETADVSVYRYKVIFKPSVLIPDVDLSIPTN